MSYGQSNKPEEPLSLMPDRDTETGKKTGHSIWKRRRLYPKGHKVGTSYEKSKVFDARFFKEKLFTFKNLDATNNLLYKIEACLDPEDWHELIAETTITPAAVRAREWDNAAWGWYRVQCKSSAGNVGLLVMAAGL